MISKSLAELVLESLSRFGGSKAGLNHHRAGGEGTGARHGDRPAPDTSA